MEGEGETGTGTMTSERTYGYRWLMLGLFGVLVPTIMTKIIHTKPHIPKSQWGARRNIASMTASVVAIVPIAPPTSGVAPWQSTSVQDSRIAVAGMGCPSQSSIIAADRNAPAGLAIPIPAISGADPCTGSNS